MLIKLNTQKNLRVKMREKKKALWRSMKRELSYHTGTEGE